MAKNTRPRRSNLDTANPRSYSELIKQERQANTPVKAAAVDAQPTPVKPVAVAAADNVNWMTEYAQVIADLRQLLIISAVLFVAMIVLGFVL